VSTAAQIELSYDRLTQAVGRPHVELDGERVTVRPGSATEIADVLRVAGEVGLALGVGARTGVRLDLERMRNVLHLDETSLLVSAQAGLTFDALERLLGERGLTLGPMIASSRGRGLGALLAAPRPSEASPRTGRFVSQCCGVAGLLADGTEITTRVAPRKATGPDLMHAIVGGRGTLGIITSATLRIYRRGEVREDAAFQFGAPEAALRAARSLLVSGGRPLDLVVAPSPPTLSITVDGAPPHAAAERELAERIARGAGGQPVPFQPLAPSTRAAHERVVPLEKIEAAVPTREGRVVGWHLQGAAVVDPSRAPSSPSAHPLTVLLKRRLDPDRRFPEWPGA
jgi:FAD/FMN-containing dehydrogenase